MKERKSPTTTEQPAPTPVLPPPAVVEANDRANDDPLVRMLIDNLNTRLSEAYEDLERKNEELAVSAADRARLQAELDDKRTRLERCTVELEEKTMKTRILYRKLDDLNRELDMTRRKLSLCEQQGPHQHGGQYPGAHD